MKVTKQLRASIPRHDISLAYKFRELLDSVVPFQSFADSSRGGIVDRHVQCAQSPMHVVESAAPSGSSRLHSSMNFESRN